MTRQAWIGCLLLVLAACARSLPPPVVPLVATPEQAWRRDAPPLAEPRAVVPPEIENTQLANGIHVLSAVVTDAPYSEVELLVSVAGNRTAALLVAKASLHMLANQLDQLTPILNDDEAGLRFRWRCEPDRIEDALRAIQALFSVAPSAADVERTRRGNKLQAKRASMSLMLAVKIALRSRLGVRNPARVPAQSAPEQHDFDLRSAHATLFDPAHAAVAVAGTTAAADVQTLAERYLGELASAAPNEPARATTDQAPPTATPPSKSIVWLRASQQLAVIAFGFAMPGWASPQSVEASVLANMLDGSHVSSLLNASLREQHGLTYVVSADYEASRGSGMLWGVLAVDNERVPETLQLLQRSFDQLKTLPQAAALSLAKQHLLDQIAMRSGRVELMLSMLDAHLTDANTSWFDASSVERLEQLDAEALRAAAQTILTRPLFVVAGSRQLLDILGDAKLDFEGAH